MRSSDCSSDVCSSDLQPERLVEAAGTFGGRGPGQSGQRPEVGAALDADLVEAAGPEKPPAVAAVASGGARATGGSLAGVGLGHGRAPAFGKTLYVPEFEADFRRLGQQKPVARPGPFLPIGEIGRAHV